MTYVLDRERFERNQALLQELGFEMMGDNFVHEERHLLIPALLAEEADPTEFRRAVRSVACDA
jgi:hypothetical protein